MNELQKRALIERHRDSLAQYGCSPQTLFWATRGIQKVRFRVLADIGIARGDSLLDVGCGFGELSSWLASHALAVDYTGLDLSPDIIGRARSMHPDATLMCGELVDFDFAPLSFDWVMLSGMLNWQLHDDGAYARRVIERMYALCRFGVAFNLLDARHPEMQGMHDLVAFDPEQILEYCAGIATDCQYRGDYLSNDFTIYMRRTG